LFLLSINSLRVSKDSLTGVPFSGINIANFVQGQMSHTFCSFLHVYLLCVHVLALNPSSVRKTCMLSLKHDVIRIISNHFSLCVSLCVFHDCYARLFCCFSLFFCSSVFLSTLFSPCCCCCCCRCCCCCC